MAKKKYLDQLGLSTLTGKIIDLIKSHISNSQIHLSQNDRDNITNVGSIIEDMNEATESANSAASYATSIGQDLVTRLNNGEFNGKDGIVFTSTGQFSFEIVEDNLILIYPEGETPPNFKINENGYFIYTYGEEE